MHEDTLPVVLAGGLGTRLRPAVPDRPKVLAPVGGRPFLLHLLERLRAAGFRRAVLATGHGADLVRRTLGERIGSLALLYSCESEPLDTGGAARFAVQGRNYRDALVMNGDSFLDLDVRRFVSWHRRQGAVASMALVRVGDTARYGRVALDPGGRVRRFEEKGACGGPGWINGGMYLFRRGVLESFPIGRLSLEHEVFPALARRGELFGHCCEGPFIDIGIPSDYGRAGTFFAALAGGGGE